MPSEIIEISSYQYYQFSTRTQSTKAVAICRADGGRRVYLYFRGGPNALPEAKNSGNNYYLYYAYGDMANVIDMLRNEKPIYLIYVPEGSNNTRISTMNEPVGEGEEN